MMSVSHVPRDIDLGCMRSQGYSGAVILAPTKGIFCGGDALAGALMRCPPQHPWGLF